MFFLSVSTINRTLKEEQLITYGLIKLAATGLYAKAIERWNVLAPADRSAWTQFRAFIIAQYERMLTETDGPTAGQQGYGSAFNATQE